MMFACPVQVDAGIDVGRLMEETIAERGLLHKDIYLTCQIDPSQWTRALHGQAPLDLWRLRQISDLQFWAIFLRKFSGALVEYWFKQKHVDVRMARASLHAAHDEQKRA